MHIAIKELRLKYAFFPISMRHYNITRIINLLKFMLLYVSSFISK